MKSHFFQWSVGAVVFSGLAWSAPLSVTSVTTTDVNTGVVTVRNGITDTSAIPVPYNVTYDGIERRISTLTAGGGTYAPTAFGTAVTRRNSAISGFPLPNANQTTAFNVVQSASGSDRTVSGRYLNTMDPLFTSRNILTGTENLFVNTSASVGDVVSNVERMDFLFSGGFLASTDKAFSVFERGLGAGGNGVNGGFQIAAITAVDAFGVPTNFSTTVVSIADNSYNNGGVGIGTLASNYDVYRFQTAAGPELDTINNISAGPQGLAGVLVLTTDFVPAGTQIFGYAVFGEDVTGTGSQLVNVNSAFFPSLSPISNDVDLVATGAVIYTLIPEPSSSLMLLSAVGLLAFRRTRQNKSAA